MKVLTGDVSGMRWCTSNRADPAAARLADRHYNRQKPGTPQFVPTGSCVDRLWTRILGHVGTACPVD